MRAMHNLPFAIRPHTVALALCLLLALAQCSPSASSTPTSSATVSSTPTPVYLAPLTPLPPQRRGQSVVLVMLAGARAADVEKFIADGTMPTLARIGSLGVKADYLQPLDPTLAAATQLSMLTSASPARTGIVADTFRLAAQSIGQSASAADVASAVEPVWRSAMRYGLRAALVGYPPSLLSLSAMRADLMVTSGGALAPSSQHVLKFGEAKEWKNAPPSFSAPKEARSSIAQVGGAPLDLYVLALDTTDDKQENYDTWLLSRSKTIDDTSSRLRLGEWGTLLIDPLLQSVAAFKITDANPAHFTVYQTPLMVNQIAPVDVAREVTRRFGPAPAPAATDAFERNWIDEGTLLQMGERQSEWLAAASGFIYQQYKPDLLVVRLSVIEDAEREFLLSDARQPRYSPARAQFLASAVRRAYEIADSALSRLFIQLDSNTNALLVVSDRGMLPVHTLVNLNKLLSDRKWLTTQRPSTAQDQGRSGQATVDVPKSKAYAEASDGLAHIYISLKGRDANGTVEQVDYDKLQSEIVGALNDVKDPADGQTVFARVLRRQELSALNLQNENSGDIVVQARPGFALSSAHERNAVLEPAPFLGASGYDASLAALRGIFVAQGAGIRQGGRVAVVRALDVAPTIAALLRFTPPTFVEGKVIEGALK